MDDPNQPAVEQPPTNAEGGEEIVPATQFSQEENEDGSSPQNNEQGAPSNNEHQETPNNPRIFATPGKPPNQQRDNLEEDINMNEEDEEMVAETPHFNRNQQGKYNCVLP